MEVFVTGAGGFLGSALCRELRTRGDTVATIDSRCDLRRSDSLGELSHPRYDVIFHLAAWTEAGDFCLSHAGEQWVFNQLINANLLRWWSQCQPQAKLVAIGTSCAYDPTSNHSESLYLDGQPTDSLFSYAMTKRMLLIGLRAIKEQWNLHFLHVVPSTLYGPGYKIGARQPHFIIDIMRKILRGKELGEEVVLWGDGNQRREVVLISDFVKALLLLLDRNDVEMVNIGEGRDRSIREFAALVSGVVGYDASRIRYDETRYVGAKAKRLCVDRFHHILPHFVSTPFEEGVVTTLNWIAASEGLKWRG